MDGDASNLVPHDRPDHSDRGDPHFAELEQQVALLNGRLLEMQTAPHLQMRSAQIDQLLPPFVELQGSLVSLRRNRKVKISYKAKEGREAGGYEHKYVTFDTIMDMVREPLHLNGFCLHATIIEIQGAGERSIANANLWLTCYHGASGQWIAAKWPMRVSFSPQDTAVSATYAQRYATRLLFNIASNDDDEQGPRDGGRRIVESTDDIDDRQESDPQRNRRVFEGLKAGLRVANDILGLLAVAKVWHDDLDVLVAWRDGERYRQQFEQMASGTAAAINHHFGSKLSRAWAMATAAHFPDDAKAVRAFLNTDCGEALKAVRGKHKQIYTYVRLIFENLLARADSTPEPSTLSAEEELLFRAPDPEPAAFTKPEIRNSANLQKAALPTDEEIDEQNRQAIDDLVGRVEQGNAAQPGGTGFCHCVFDETGDAVCEEITDPAEWADVYGGIWADASNLTEVARMNAAALEDLQDGRFPDAVALLKRKLEESGETSASPGIASEPSAELPPIEWPLSRGGQGLDVAKCVKLVTLEMEQLGSHTQWQAWLDNNSIALRDKRLPNTTKMKIEGLVMARGQQLQEGNR